MNVLILGKGGREHAIAKKLLACSEKHEVFLMPGTTAISEEGLKVINQDLGADQNFKPVLEAIREFNISFVIVGPEDLLSKGIVDLIEANGVAVFGPSKAASLLESSKSFAKAFMDKYKIPTAKFKIAKSFEEAISELSTFDVKKGIAVKSDALAAGKGVVVTSDIEEAKKTIFDFMLNKDCEVQTSELVLEEKLHGFEVSVFALFNGLEAGEYRVLGYATDYKRVYDGDQGPNTGGMGAFSSNNILSDKLKNKINEQVFDRVLQGLKEENLDFRGVLFAGLMIDTEDVNVIEFNVRFGDPETQALMPRLDADDFFDSMYSCASKRKFSKASAPVSNKESVHIVLCSKNYPSIDGTKMLLDQEIKINESYFKTTKYIDLYFSGTVKKQNAFYNSGGRVLGVTSYADNLALARENAYQAVEQIQFEGAHYRRDIAKK